MNTPMTRFVPALVLSLAATACPGIAQPPEATPEPEPTLELVVGPDFQWMEPDLLRISFELRNTGTEPLVVAQRPGLFLGLSCLTENGARGIIPGGIACGLRGAAGDSFLELRPGEALLGEKVVKAPEECVGDITVWGEFQTLTADAWDLPAREARIVSKRLLIGKR